MMELGVALAYMRLEDYRPPAATVSRLLRGTAMGHTIGSLRRRMIAGLSKSAAVPLLLLID